MAHRRALFWGVIGFGLGAAAQFALTHGQPVLALLGYGIAVWLFVSHMRPYLAGASRSDRESSRSPATAGENAERMERRSRWDIRRGGQRRIGPFLLALAAIGCCFALLSFAQDEGTRLGWPLYIGSTFLFIIALDALSIDGHRDAQPLRFTGTAALFALVILVIAVFLRLYEFPAIPFGTFYDEAEYGIEARRLLLQPGQHPIYYPTLHAPIHYVLLITLTFRWLGVGVLAVRVVAATFGLGLVVVGFFLGREAYGTRFGLILAFFLAIARWPLTFSRLGLWTLTTPFFASLTLLFLLRARRTNSARHFGWAGLALGLGLCFHTSFRLFALGAVAFAICGCATLWYQSRGKTGSTAVGATGLMLFLLGAGLAVAPVAQFAVREPGIFWARTRHVSIFENRDEPDLGRAIASNTVKHLLMFNYQGDQNGRHNLPGEPMLDPITRVLFVLGFALALSRPHLSLSAPVIMLFIAGLSAGVFSLDFEAPQAQRAAGAVPAVLFFVALAVESFWRVLEKTGRGLRALVVQRGGMAALLAAGGLILYLNAHTYFVRQANDPVVWAEHHAVETLTARKMNELDPDKTTFYVSQFLHDHRVIQFLAPGAQDSRVIHPSGTLPLREPGDRPVALFVGQEQAWVAEEVPRYYPGADHSVSRDPAGHPVLHTVVVRPEDIQEVQGLTARYWAGGTGEGTALVARKERSITAHWPGDAPVTGEFLAEWQGILYVPEFGEIEFSLLSPAAAALWLDGQPVLDSEREGDHRQKLTMAQGNHDLRVRALRGEGHLRLAWRANGEAQFETIPPEALYQSPPVDNHGLVAAFHWGAEWEQAPALMRIDPFIDTYFHLIPLPRPYGVEWTGEVEAPTTGDYAFGLRVRGQAQLFIDDHLVAEALEPTDYVEGKTYLKAGRHALRLRFRDHLDYSRLHLFWTPPNQTRQVIPSHALYPYSQAE